MSAKFYMYEYADGRHNIKRSVVEQPVLKQMILDVYAGEVKTTLPADPSTSVLPETKHDINPQANLL